jgi:hypothetical protein
VLNGCLPACLAMEHIVVHHLHGHYFSVAYMYCYHNVIMRLYVKKGVWMHQDDVRSSLSMHILTTLGKYSICIALKRCGAGPDNVNYPLQKKL